MIDCEPSMSYEEMKRALINASDAYYNKSFSIMSDAEFDKLKDEFTEHWPDDPFIKTIGAPVPVNTKWNKVKHLIPMRSCNKVNTVDEFMKWLSNVGLMEQDIVISEKLDGISLSLDYQKGNLIRATTRGDGTIGEDITTNVLRMQNVKRKLPIPYTGSLRGEVMLKNNDFNSVNLVCESRGERTYQNVRNGASGIARNYDGKYCEYLYVEYYYASGDFTTKKNVYDFIEHDLGLKTCKHFVGNAETAKIVYNEYEEEIRAGLDHAIDGLVIEPNRIEILENLGLLHENWKGMIAWKFTSDKAKTPVKSSVWQLGNSGRITPVAIMNTVELMGVNVSRASVHNLEIFRSINLHEGDILLIERANDVIPKVVKNLSDHPGCERGPKLEVPEFCPVCGEKAYEDGVFLVCKNDKCKGGQIGNLKKWVKKLDLKGIAEATLEKLYDADYVKTPADLYRLEPHLICEIDGFKTRSASRIIETLNSKKEVTLSEFIAGLNIPNFSGKTAELLEKNGFDSLKKMMNAQEYELTEIKGIGIETARAIIIGLQKKIKIIEDLLDVGINIKSREENSNTGNPFSGKKVVFTGALNIKRKDAQTLVKSVGGECPSSLSKDTDYLVMADVNSTSSKANKARSYGTKILSEDQFIKMIGD